MKLPVLISVPHAGLEIPEEVRDKCILKTQDLIEDSDIGALELYNFESDVAAFVTTNAARAIVDLNRAPDDFGADGVVKTYTCWGIPIYQKTLLKDQTKSLLERYYWPYHAKLTALSKNVLFGLDCHTMSKLTALSKNVLFGLDCHTMSAIAPSVSPNPGQNRPKVCLSNANTTCPQPWLDLLASYLAEELVIKVSINEPFKGGHIIRTHSKEIPWIQLELSRTPFLSLDVKRSGVLRALRRFCKALGSDKTLLRAFP
jgi:formiminoglutamase